MFKKLSAVVLSLSLIVGIFTIEPNHVTATAGPQIFYGRNSDAAPVSTSRRLKLNDFVTAASFATSTFGVLPISGTFSNLKVDVDTAPGGATSWVATLVEGASTNTALTCTITSAITSCSDISHTFSASAGLAYHVNVVATGGSPAATYIRFSVQFTPSITGHTALLAGGAYNTATQVYSTISVNAGAAGTESNRRQIIPEAGTLQNLYVDISASPGVGASYINALRTSTANVAASSSLACTVSGASARSCNDTVDTYSVSANDLVDYALTPAVGPAASNPGMGIDFTPTTAGDFLLPSFFNGADSASALTYMPVVGSLVPTTKEASTTLTAQAMTITAIAATTTASSGAGKSHTFYLRQNNATTSLSCAISGTARNCSGTGSVSIAAGDSIDIVDEPAGTPATLSTVSITLIANANTASPSTVDTSSNWFLAFY